MSKKKATAKRGKKTTAKKKGAKKAAAPRARRRRPSLQRILKAIEQTDADVRRYTGKSAAGNDVLRFLSGLREVVSGMCLPDEDPELQAVPFSFSND